MNRRARHRFPSPELTLSIQRPNQLFGKRFQAEPLDFNKDGIAFYCNENFDIGDRVELNLCLSLMRTTLKAEHVVAVIRSKRGVEGKTRYGAQFDYQANRTMRSLKLQAVLGRIEGIMERHIKFKLKTAPPDQFDPSLLP